MSAEPAPDTGFHEESVAAPTAPASSAKGLTPEQLDAAVIEAVASCGGDLAATVRALIVANDFLAEQNAALACELDYAWHWVSPGFTRSTRKRKAPRRGEQQVRGE
jgi:hypothetical protein